jgi:hypothetical protein
MTSQGSATIVKASPNIDTEPPTHIKPKLRALRILSFSHVDVVGGISSLMGKVSKITVSVDCGESGYNQWGVVYTRVRYYVAWQS